MIFKKNHIGDYALMLVILVTAAGVTWLALLHQWSLMVVAFLVLLYLISRVIRKQQQTEALITEFTEAIQYKDFTRRFNIEKAPFNRKKLFQGMNEINEAFRQLQKEKKTEAQHFQQMLELVQVAIISFDVHSGEVLLINESFRQLTDIPYIKNIASLQQRNPNLDAILRNIRPEEESVAEFARGGQLQKLLIQAALIVQDGKTVKLISLQNVNNTLEQAESQAWQKLLHVMTHEIMNSVAPISSLADTLKTDLERPLTEADLADLKLGLDTIQKRSDGLQRFAVTYRNLNKVSRPELRSVRVMEIFETMQALMQPTLDERNIELEVLLKDPGLIIEMDKNLIEQVLINLITNAMEALREQPAPRISLSAMVKDNRPVIQVLDNGSGIAAELTDKIFVPFFSTRKNGNGIGLSLCKQIMTLHKGSIRLSSEPGIGTCFSLRFPG
jgi:nitrogen fixation/metabolism regulation signal transduction histidine kinase